jgi:acyl-coenzyme A thioesterase PaaI-like protein
VRVPWPEPGWAPADPFPFTAARGAFAGMTSDEKKVSVSYYRRPDSTLAAVVRFGPLSEGAPGLVHGGAILTALDESLGAAAWLAGIPSLTARLTTDFRRGVPAGAVCLVSTRLLGERHRVASLEGELVGADGAVYARAEGRFIRLSDDAHRRIFGRGPD